MGNDLWFFAGDLICPVCHSALELTGHESLMCRKNGHYWPVHDGVARLCEVPEQPDVRNTIESFAFKWDVDINAMKRERQRVAVDWFFARFGADLGVDDQDGGLLPKCQRILDAGCGPGHLTEELARRAPQAQVWGVDMTRAVDAVGRVRNLRVVQADLTQLPIARSFDLIVSDGVLHHTHDTFASVKALAQKLMPRGHLMFYVYKQKAPIREFADNLIREHLAGSDPKKCLEVCATIADLGRQLREANVTLTFEKPIPFLGIEKGSLDLQRWFYWTIMKCFWDDSGDVLASTLENFDWYHPPLAHRHTVEEVRQGMEDAGLNIESIVEHDSGIAAHGTRG